MMQILTNPNNARKYNKIRKYNKTKLNIKHCLQANVELLTQKI
jgi:hypothetical protein